MRGVNRVCGQQKRCMGLWLIILGILFAAAVAAGKGTGVNAAVIAYGFVISFFLIFLNRRIVDRLKQGELDLLQQKILDYSVAFLFLLMFFIVSPFFKIFSPHAGWALVLGLIGIHNLILSLVHGKSMLVLGGIVLLNALLLFVGQALPVWSYLLVYSVFMLGFGIGLFVKKPKMAEAAR